MTDDAEHRRLIIAGSGIAGLSAAIYAARSNNNPLVLEGPEPGGQLTLTTDVANYPGFPEGIGGPELINNMKAQAEQFGAEIDTGVLVDVDPGTPHRIELRDGTVYTADALIAASGASARTLGVPGEDELMGYGVSTCATCDGAFFRDEDMIVVGGGDAACEEATFLTKFADTVYIVHRREEFRAEDYWVDRVREHEDDGEIKVLTNTELLAIDGSAADGVESVTLARNPEGHPKEKLDDPSTERFEMNVGAVFMAIGHTPTPAISKTPVSSWTRPATSIRSAVRAAARPERASKGSSAPATWSISTTSRPSRPAAWGRKPPSTPTPISRTSNAEPRRRPIPPQRTTDRPIAGAFGGKPSPVAELTHDTGRAFRCHPESDVWQTRQSRCGSRATTTLTR
jgi:thioredoxin reductase (NADPH)